jgi:hypothetical protein
MFSGRTSISDPDLGECIVFGGSRLVVVMFLVLGCGLLVASVVGTSGAAGPSGPALVAAGGAVCLICAAWFWRTHLAIGTRGFRFVRPFRRVQLLWSQVAACDLIDENTKQAQLVVRLWDGRDRDAGCIKIESGGITFSASGHAIRALMAERLKAFWAAVPDQSGPKPATGQDEAQELHSVGPLDWQDK